MTTLPHHHPGRLFNPSVPQPAHSGSFRPTCAELRQSGSIGDVSGIPSPHQRPPGCRAEPSRGRHEFRQTWSAVDLYRFEPAPSTARALLACCPVLIKSQPCGNGCEKTGYLPPFRGAKQFPQPRRPSLMHIKGEISDKCEHHGHNMNKKIIVRNTKENVKRLPSSPATGKSTVPRKGSRKEPRLDSIPPDLFGSSISSPAGKKSSGQKGLLPVNPASGNSRWSRPR